MKSKAAVFRTLLERPELDFIMEAHNGLSAKIVEEAGFAGVWASGLAISAMLGLRDSNEASWTEVLTILEFMSDATRVPILVDGDTGHGNFNNVRRLVKKLCQRNIAGVCIEDKVFPKTNSFIGDFQPLADVDEFCGRIKAGKDSQTDEAFSLVARTEALVSGWGVDEALRRAEAYHAAGADAILVHSKSSTFAEIERFTQVWNRRSPVVIVPTTYSSTHAAAFAAAGVSLVIWANHNLRAAIHAMRHTSAHMARDRSADQVTGSIATVQDIFELVDSGELADAERRYLPANGRCPAAVLLGASRGAQLGELTEDRPKCMVDIRGKPLLSRLVHTVAGAGIRDITVVRGYKKEAIDVPGIHSVDNDEYATTGQLASLDAARDKLRDGCLIAYADVLFRDHLVQQLLDCPGEIVLTVDALWQHRHYKPTMRLMEMVSCSRPFRGGFLDQEEPAYLRALRIDDSLPAGEAHGEWIGVLRVSRLGGCWCLEEMDAMAAEGLLKSARLSDLITRLVECGRPIAVQYITGDWLDVDDLLDLATARNLDW